jgi:putative DNA primase/helicase
MARGFRPCWSTGGKSILAAFPVLPAIDSLTIFADNDPDGGGLRAAQAAQARWRAAGREAHVRMTKAHGDLNDVRDRGAA